MSQWRPFAALFLPCLVVAGWTLAGAQPEKAKRTAAPARKQSPAAGKASAPSRKQTAKKKAAKGAPRPRTQQSPEPERIRQIQQALVERGYDCPVSGVWDAGSAAALARFQEDQSIKNLTGPGKLDPLTLIALGLGPSQASPPAQQGPPVTAAEEKEP